MMFPNELFAKKDEALWRLHNAANLIVYLLWNEYAFKDGNTEWNEYGAADSDGDDDD
jgi:hypothetical protein